MGASRLPEFRKGGNYRSRGPTLEERRSQPRRAPGRSIFLFQDALKNGFQLEDSKRPDDMKHSKDPNYFPYHRLLGHTMEDC